MIIWLSVRYELSDASPAARAARPRCGLDKGHGSLDMHIFIKSI